jgi:acid stress chaperone HdeA
MKATAPVAMVVFTLLFSGCSVSQLVNTGGDTKCKDFTTQDEKKQDEEVSKMLKDRSGADPASLQITANRVSLQTWCQTLGKPDSKISEMPHL